MDMFYMYFLSCHKEYQKSMYSRVDHFYCFIKDLLNCNCPSFLPPSLLFLFLFLLYVAMKKMTTKYNLVPLPVSHKPNPWVLEPPGVHRSHFETHCFMLFIFSLFFLWWQPASCHSPCCLWKSPPLLAVPNRSMSWGNSSWNYYSSWKAYYWTLGLRTKEMNLSPSFII